MSDWKEKDIEDDWMNQLLKESAMIGRGKVRSMELPAWLKPGPRKKYTTEERKKRKTRRKISAKSRHTNRRRK